jgi:copper chaperone CopZ
MKYTTKLQLSGLSCGACEKVISKRLQKLKGVEEVRVSLQNEQASITAGRNITKDEVAQALLGTHYKVITIL